MTRLYVYFATLFARTPERYSYHTIDGIEYVLDHSDRGAFYDAVEKDKEDFS